MPLTHQIIQLTPYVRIVFVATIYVLCLELLIVIGSGTCIGSDTDHVHVQEVLSNFHIKFTT